MTPRTTPASTDIEFSDGDFASVSKIAKALYGLNLEASKKAMIKSRLSKRITALGLNSFAEYCDLVDRGAGAENDNFITALTTNVTHFYREKHHFDMFETEVFPPLMERLKTGGRVRLWSAGCSSGQEPYSLAASILHKMPDAARRDLRILGTDIDPAILQEAERGRYARANTRFPSESYERRLSTSTSKESDIITIRPDIAALVTFRRLNLQDDWPFSGTFDAIFCRNVAIYFDRDTQSKLWARLAQALSPGGYLFIGHSERLHGPALDQLQNVGITTYKRRDIAAPQTKGAPQCH